MSDSDELLTLIEAHRKTCFKKASCPICAMPEIDDDTKIAYVFQCDCCGKVSNTQIHGPCYYKCKCPTKSTICICQNCVDNNHYKITKSACITSGIEDTYEDQCCLTMTKAARSVTTKNVDELLKMVKYHRETCFNKSCCHICAISSDESVRSLQCACCGHIYGLCSDWIRCYDCKCPKNNSICICIECTNKSHPYEITHPDTTIDDLECTYTGPCCLTLTKAAR